MYRRDRSEYGIAHTWLASTQLRVIFDVINPSIERNKRNFGDQTSEGRLTSEELIK